MMARAETANTGHKG